MTASIRPTWAWSLHPILLQPHDDFFTGGDAICRPQSKQVIISAPQDDEAVTSASFKCQAADCGLVFSSIRQHESHYNSQHRHPCVECRRSFPTSHLLDIHITESHNPMFEILAQKQNMYQCLLETCTDKFRTYPERRDHMIKTHKYPANFRFEKTQREKKQINLPKQRKQKPSDVMETDSMDTGAKMVSMTTSKSLATTATRQSPLSLSNLAHDRIPRNDQDLRSMDSGLYGAGENPDLCGAGSGRSMDIDPGMDAEKSCKRPDTIPDPGASSGHRFIYKPSVPRTICFGAGSQRGFYGRGRGRRGRHWHQTKSGNSQTTCDIEDVNMDELSEALDQT